MDFREIVPAVASANPGGIIVVAIGSGTILDTSRFRMLLAEHSDGIDDVYLSVPTVLGRGGVERTLRLALSAEEASGLRHSAELLRATIDTLELDPR